MAVAIASADRLDASVVAYDGFNYTAGLGVPDTGGSSLRGGNGFSTTLGWADNSPDSNANAYVITSAGLAYTPPSGGTLTVAGNALNRGTDNLGAFRNLAATIPGTTDATYYISYLFQAAGDPKVASGSYAGATFGIYMGLAANGTGNSAVFAVGSGYASNQVKTAVALSPGQTYLLVGKIQISAAGNDTASLWVNPVVSSETEAGAAQAISSGVFNISQIARTDIYESNATYGITVDEIRLGTTWADVTPGLPVTIPEPASMGLAGVSVLGLAMRRRRRD